MNLDFEELKKRKRELDEALERGKPPAWFMRHLVWQKLREDKGCPDDEEFAVFYEGGLMLRRRLAIRWHIFWCAFCRMELYELHEALRDE